MRLTDEHAAFRASVRSFVESEIDPHAEEWEAAGIFPAHELFPKAAALGLLGLERDPEYGGEGADHSFQMVAAEELGRADVAGVAMAIGVQSMMATPSLHTFGTPEQKREFLAPAIAGTAVTSIAVTEPDTGSDVSRLRTRARTTPASTVCPWASSWTVHSSAGRTSPGSRLAAPSESTDGCSGLRRSGP